MSEVIWGAATGGSGGSVPAFGFGAMRLSTAGRPDRDEAIGVLRAVVDAGVRLVDTADAYCLTSADTGHNEELIADAIGRRDDVVVATKGGHVRDPAGGWHTDGRPEHLRAACDASLRRLRRDTIDLYFFHRPDPATPFEESVGAMRELHDAGKVRHVGLSNVDVAQLDSAAVIVDVAAVQNELSPDVPDGLDVLRACAERGIPFLAWGPLGGGAAAELGARHPALGTVAARYGCSPQRVAIAWLRSLDPLCIPIPGGRRVSTVLDSLAGTGLALSPEDLDALAGLVRDDPA